MEHILLHEYYHIRRLDALWKYVLVLALSLHWFNPLVWVLFALANRDLELSCDELAVRQLGPRERTAYTHSLISAAELVGLSPLSSGFGSHSMEERVTAVMKYRRPSVGALLATVLLVAASTADFAPAPAGGNPLPHGGQLPQPAADGSTGLENPMPPANPAERPPQLSGEGESIALLPPLAHMQPQTRFEQTPWPWG